MFRVTTILTLEGLSQPFHATEESRVRGTAVHLAAERLSEGYAPAPGYEAYTDGLHQWFNDHAPHVFLTERRLVNRDLQLTGRLDLGAVLVQRPFIVDIKTGGKCAWHGLQTAAYELLATSEPMVLAAARQALRADDHTRVEWGRAILYLPGNHTYQWVEHADPMDGYLFRSALALVRWRAKHGLVTIQDSETPDDDPVVTPDVRNGFDTTY